MSEALIKELEEQFKQENIQIEKLYQQIEELEKNKKELSQKLKDSKKQLFIETKGRHTLSTWVDAIHELKDYLDKLMKTYPNNQIVRYKFEEETHYLDENDDPILESFSWEICQRNYYKSQNVITITIYHYGEGSKEFMKEWMIKNIPYAKSCEEW